MSKTNNIMKNQHKCKKIEDKTPLRRDLLNLAHSLGIYGCPDCHPNEEWFNVITETIKNNNTFRIIRKHAFGEWCYEHKMYFPHTYNEEFDRWEPKGE